MSDKDKGQPMDPTYRESAVGTMHVNRPRIAWALKQLVAEVEALFPETAVTYGNEDKRNTSLSATFVCTDPTLADLLGLLDDPAYNEDRRIESVTAQQAEGEPEEVTVTLLASARTQDSRTPYGLADAYEVLVGHDGGQS